MSGETKGLGTFLGESAPDTGVTSLYVGPQIVASFGRFSGKVGVDLPVIMEYNRVSNDGGLPHPRGHHDPVLNGLHASSGKS